MGDAASAAQLAVAVLVRIKYGLTP